jgi:hypothetical protein
MSLGSGISVVSGIETSLEEVEAEIVEAEEVPGEMMGYDGGVLMGLEDGSEGTPGEGITGEGITGEGITGEGITGEGITGEGVLGEGTQRGEGVEGGEQFPHTRVEGSSLREVGTELKVE